MADTRAFILPDRLEGERLYLEAYHPSFELANEFYAVVEQNREHLLPWLDWAMPEVTGCPEDSFMYFKSTEKKWLDGDSFEYLIRHKSDHRIMGGIGVMGKDKTHTVYEIGYWLARDFCKKGAHYMDEAVQLCEKELFMRQAERIIIRNDTENIPSKRVAERCGYTFEGIARKGRYSSYYRCCRDMNVFAKTKE